MRYVAAETCSFFSLKDNSKNAGPLKNLRCSRNTATHILELVEGPQIGQKCYTIFDHALAQRLPRHAQILFRAQIRAKSPKNGSADMMR